MGNPDNDFKMNLVKHHGLYRDIDYDYEFKDEATKLALFELVDTLELWPELERLLKVEKGDFAFSLKKGEIIAITAISHRMEPLTKPLFLRFPQLKHISLELLNIKFVTKSILNFPEVTQIESLNLKMPSSCVYPIWFEGLKNIKRLSLDIFGVEFIRDKDIEIEFPKLKSLNIRLKDFEKIPFFVNSLINSARNLNYFQLRLTNSTLDTLKFPLFVKRIDLKFVKTVILTELSSTQEGQSMTLNLDKFTLKNANSSFMKNIHKLDTLRIGGYELEQNVNMSDLSELKVSSDLVENKLFVSVDEIDSMKFVEKLNCKYIHIQCHKLLDKINLDKFNNINVEIYEPWKT